MTMMDRRSALMHGLTGLAASLVPDTADGQNRAPMSSFDPRDVPFSVAGSYLSINYLLADRWKVAGVGYRGPDRIFLRTVRGESAYFGGDLPTLGNVAALVPACDCFALYADPHRFRIDGGGGSITATFVDRLTIRFEGQGLGMDLIAPPVSRYDNIQQTRPDTWVWNAVTVGSLFTLRRVAGDLQVGQAWDGVRDAELTARAGGERWVVEITEREFRQQTVETNYGTYEDWCGRVPSLPVRYGAARSQAAYILWSALVAPSGNFRRPAILMSKNWMTSLYSWDHCFNAIALAERHPGMAWHQLMVPFDHQTIDGRLPDRIQEKGLVWNFVKPPIHGWALRQMARRGAISRVQLAGFYPQLARFTRSWFTPDNLSARGLPIHKHGNDSGWDNATLFKGGMPVEAPDLTAILVSELDALAWVATRLGKIGEAAAWRKQADDLLDRLVSTLWDGRRFVAPRTADGGIYPSDSLILSMPMMLGKRLPEAIRRAIVAGLREDGRFLCHAGLASESLRSADYEANGYWRGPTWAPTLLMLVEGLADCGETALARQIATRFADTCARSGFAENFDSRTGAPLCDRAYTWTASVFLSLGRYLT